MVAKRIVLPGEKLNIKTDSVTETHLVVVKGIGRATIDNQSKQLNKGESVNISGKQVFVLENSGTELFSIIKVNYLI